MTTQPAMPVVFYADTQAQASFGESGPQPLILADTERLKVVVAGLEPGQQIPSHPETMAVYHFLQGSGFMDVGGTAYPVTPGATVIVPAGVDRGMRAQSRLIFLAAKSG